VRNRFYSGKELIVASSLYTRRRKIILVSHVSETRLEEVKMPLSWFH